MQEKKVGEIIAEAREKAGLSQRQLAKIANISNAQLSKIESGEIEIPNPKMLRKICDHIDANYQDLMYMIGLGMEVSPLNPFIKNYYSKLNKEELYEARLNVLGSINNSEKLVESCKENLNKENAELQYHAAWSNECIEFWFLLHFAYYTSNNHRTEYVSFLNDRFKELGLGKYQKNMTNIFDILAEKGNPKLAIRYAKRIIKDGKGKTPTELAPGTKVYELVEELAKYLPEKCNKLFTD